MIVFMILLALVNGFLIVSVRIVNAKLGGYISASGAAIWNHLVGFLFLGLILPFLGGETAVSLKSIPLILYLGGMIGAGYVAINNWVMPKVGATQATVLVISGQLLTGVIIDMFNGKVTNIYLTFVGIFFVIVGIWVGSRTEEEAV